MYTSGCGEVNGNGGRHGRIQRRTGGILGKASANDLSNIFVCTVQEGRGREARPREARLGEADLEIAQLAQLAFVRLSAWHTIRQDKNGTLTRSLFT